jgi:hypothetical protein
MDDVVLESPGELVSLGIAHSAPMARENEARNVGNIEGVEGEWAQPVLELVEEWYELLLLVGRILRIDRDQIPTAGIESEVLVLQVAQALAEHRRRT